MINNIIQDQMYVRIFVISYIYFLVLRLIPRLPSAFNVVQTHGIVSCETADVLWQTLKPVLETRRFEVVRTGVRLKTGVPLMTINGSSSHQSSSVVPPCCVFYCLGRGGPSRDLCAGCSSTRVLYGFRAFLDDVPAPSVSLFFDSIFARATRLSATALFYAEAIIRRSRERSRRSNAAWIFEIGHFFEIKRIFELLFSNNKLAEYIEQS